MVTVADFEIMSRGVSSLVRDWKADRELVRGVWKIDELINWFERNLALGIKLYDHFREHGCFPTEGVTFDYFATQVRELVGAAREIDVQVRGLEETGYAVAGAESLRRGILTLDAIVEEEDFAMNTAFYGGALDEWDFRPHEPRMFESGNHGGQVLATDEQVDVAGVSHRSFIDCGNPGKATAWPPTTA
jgi:hypothetical protein